tara:strand:+ start:348 stop:908 length:561 start_codon:yes stop_codon:yes gene_type:complete
MKKFTWQNLGQIFEGQFKLTTAEAATILTGHIFNHKWKHGKDKNIGMMWRDKIIVAAFTNVLAEEEELAKQVGRKKSLRKLFDDGVRWGQFKILAGLKYKKGSEGFRTFRNDYGLWKKLKLFKGAYKTGKITSKKFEKRIKARVYGADKILNAENKNMVAGIEHTKKLLESGEFEMGPTGLRRIPK